MENIAFDEFKKMELRVGEVKGVEEVEGADRIFKLKVDIGGEERGLIAGIKLHYQKESLLGKKIIVLVNLEPKVIRGVQSHGMLLAAATEDKSSLAILTVERDMPAGTRVS
jgi:methionyl-tRNA synthetase